MLPKKEHTEIYLLSAYFHYSDKVKFNKYTMSVNIQLTSASSRLRHNELTIVTCPGGIKKHLITHCILSSINIGLKCIIIVHR